MRRTALRHSALGAAALLVTAGLWSPTLAEAAPESNSAKLRKAVTVERIKSHEVALQEIADDHSGTRASGTPGFDASGDYVTGKLEAAGYTVQRQKFDFDFFHELSPATLSQVSPTPGAYETGTFSYSGSGDVTGQLVPIDVVLPPTPTPSSTSGCEPADFPAPPSPTAVALIQRGTCPFADKAANAKAAGYAAVIIFNEGQPGRTDLIVGTLGAPETIPVVGLSFADGNALNTQALSGPVTVHVVTSTLSETRETFNVIADSPKGINADETVVVGAHLDSVFEGPGINDNGSGTAAILTIAEQMAKLKYTDKLQRQVRFAFWGAEESGLLGSEHYVANLSEAQRRGIYANLNFDMLGSPNYVRFVYDGDGSNGGATGPAGSAAIEKIFTDYFAGQGLASAPTAFDGRSDYGPFITVGIPAGGLFSGAEGVKTAEQAATYGGTAGAPYDPCYHKACDTINNLNDDALDELGDAAAHATMVVTMSKDSIYPDAASLKAQGKREGVRPKDKIARR